MIAHLIVKEKKQKQAKLKFKMRNLWMFLK